MPDTQEDKPKLSTSELLKIALAELAEKVEEHHAENCKLRDDRHAGASKVMVSILRAEKAKQEAESLSDSGKHARQTRSQ